MKLTLTETLMSETVSFKIVEYQLKAYLHVSPISHEACRYKTQTIYFYTWKVN